ncbi:winged helix-turn-helix domain-containing protein [Alphaproteobacteria bacterium]|nr:winged helix-turn-helix domain-containing protein [Alphaproteobacteria bacterium]
MKNKILLQCSSPTITKALSDYLGNSFSLTLEQDSSPLKAITFDHCPLPSDLKETHARHPNAMIYLLLHQKDKIPTAPFPVKVFERPFHLKALKIQLESSPSQALIILSEFKLYLNNRRLIHEQKEKSCILTEKEVEILTYLYKTEKCISRETLLKDVWNYADDITTHTLETHIYKLRQKLVLTSGNNVLKTTDKGYSLNL